MADAHAHPPLPVNEPVRAYAPGSSEKVGVQTRLAQLSDARTHIPMVIAGEALDGKDRATLRSPHRKDLVIGEYPMAETHDVEQAIDAALQARPAWAATPYHERAAVFLRAAALLSGAYRDTINAATMLGQSKTIFQAEIDAACELCDFWRYNVAYGDFILEQQPANDATAWNRLEYRPLEGFVLAIPPFNFTSIVGNLPTAPALMGNTVVFKPDRQTLLVAHFLMELLEAAGLPPGVINMVSGKEELIGDVCIAHPSFAGLHFTGSTAVFRQLWKKVAVHIDGYRTYPRLVGETGGKDFVVAHESADVAALKTALVRGAFEYQGQKCSAASRAYVPTTMWRRLRDEISGEVDAIPMGDVADFRNFMGAVISEEAFRRHQDAITYANREARVVAGGRTDDGEGWFVRPTVIETEDPDFRFLKEELFGPILTVYPYPDGKYEETLELCDRTSQYGLTGAIFATDRYAVEAAKNRLVNAAGNFYVNDKPTGAIVGMQPFGGARASGTNDKAGSYLNLLRWVSPRTIKETYAPPHDYRYPHMGEE